jgi:hypothetical protein
VLTASRSDTGTSSGTTCTATVFDMARLLAATNVPAYVAADRSDACPCSLPDRSKPIATALDASPARAMSIFPLDGSASPTGPGTDPCTALTPHGFYGIEDDVVSAIVSFANTH